MVKVEKDAIEEENGDEDQHEEKEAPSSEICKKLTYLCSSRADAYTLNLPGYMEAKLHIHFIQRTNYMLPTVLLWKKFLRTPLPFARKKNSLTCTYSGFPPLVHQIVTELRFSYHKLSLRNQPTLRDATTDFPILMTSHYPDLDSVSDWSCHEGNLLQPIRSTTQIIVGSHSSSVWNFCEWWRRKMLAVFSKQVLLETV